MIQRPRYASEGKTFLRLDCGLQFALFWNTVSRDAAGLTHVGSQPLVLTREPARHIILIVLREATLARSTRKIRPGFVRSEIGDKVIGRREGRFSRGGLQDVALKRCSVVAGHGILATLEAQYPPNLMIAKESVGEVEVVHTGPWFIDNAFRPLCGSPNQFALVASVPPDRLILLEQTIRCGKHHH